MGKGFFDNSGTFISYQSFQEELFSLENKEKEIARRMERWGWHKMPDKVSYYRKEKDFVRVPHGIRSYWTLDNNYRVESVKHPDFIGDLYEDQSQKVSELLQHDVGYMLATTGVGKGVMIPYIAQKLSMRTLVIVPGTQLLTEMIERFETHLGITPLKVGGAKLSKKRHDASYKDIVVTTIDSLKNVDVSSFDCVLVDECDKMVSTDSRRGFLFDMSPMKLYGFTGTKTFRNVDKRVMPMFFGVETKFTKKNFIPEVINVHTQFTTEWSMEDGFTQLNTEVLTDSDRTSLVVDTVCDSLESGETKHDLVLLNRMESIDELERRFKERGVDVFVIRGDMSKNQRNDAKKSYESSPKSVLIGSSQIVARGFDCPVIQSVHIISPVRFDATVIQSCGRAMRAFKGKTFARIYNYHDARMSLLRNQSFERMRSMKREYGSDINITNIQ